MGVGASYQRPKGSLFWPSLSLGLCLHQVDGVLFFPPRRSSGPAPMLLRLQSKRGKIVLPKMKELSEVPPSHRKDLAHYCAEDLSSLRPDPLDLGWGWGLCSSYIQRTLKCFSPKTSQRALKALKKKELAPLKKTVPHPTCCFYPLCFKKILEVWP